MTSLQSAITRKREAPQPHVLIFFLIFSSFSIKSIISRVKVFRDDPKKSLFRYILSLVTKHQIWHSWAMIILWDFFVNIFFIFSIFLFLFFILLILFFFIFIFIFFDWQRWATIHMLSCGMNNLVSLTRKLIQMDYINLNKDVWMVKMAIEQKI